MEGVSGRTLGGRTENLRGSTLLAQSGSPSGRAEPEPSSSAAGFWVDINTAFLHVSSANVGSELAIFTRQV